MINLDWIPVICQSARRNTMTRQYVRNRIGELQECLGAWTLSFKRFQCGLHEQYHRVRSRSLLASIAKLAQGELTCLEMAINDLEIWTNSGRITDLMKAQKAYDKSRKIWDKRLRMLQHIA